jgi:alkylhydroperoxidase family enzyme
MNGQRHGDRIVDLRRAIMETPGSTSREARVAAAAGEPTATVADPYLDKVRVASYRIADDDVAALKRAGLSEDAILELTLAAAFGESARRLDRVVAVMTEIGGD